MYTLIHYSVTQGKKKYKSRQDERRNSSVLPPSQSTKQHRTSRTRSLFFGRKDSSTAHRGSLDNIEEIEDDDIVTVGRKEKRKTGFLGLGGGGGRKKMDDRKSKLGLGIGNGIGEKISSVRASLDGVRGKHETWTSPPPSSNNIHQNPSERREDREIRGERDGRDIGKRSTVAGLTFERKSVFTDEMKRNMEGMVREKYGPHTFTSSSASTSTIDSGRRNTTFNPPTQAFPNPSITTRNPFRESVSAVSKKAEDEDIWEIKPPRHQKPITISPPPPPLARPVSRNPFEIQEEDRRTHSTKPKYDSLIQDRKRESAASPSSSSSSSRQSGAQVGKTEGGNGNGQMEEITVLMGDLVNFDRNIGSRT